MVIRTQIGNSPNVGILVLGLGLFSGVLLLGHVVDAALILFPIGVNHGSSITSVRITLSLHVPLFLAVPTNDVGVAGPIAEDRGGVNGGTGVAVGGLVARRVVPTDSGNLVDLLQADVVPGDVGGLGRGQAGFDGSDPLRTLVIIMDGL